MCHVLPYRAKKCNHRWLVISKPCKSGVSFRTAPPGHPFTRKRTFLGATMWYPAPPGACPDCDKKGRYDGDKVRLYLGKGGAGDRAARYGLWGPFGNGFSGGERQRAGVDGWGYGYGNGNVGMINGYGNGYGNGYSSGYGHGGAYGGGQRQGYVPGHIAMRSVGGYGYNGGYMGNPSRRYPGQRGGLLGCFGL